MACEAVLFKQSVIVFAMHEGGFHLRARRCRRKGIVSRVAVLVELCVPGTFEIYRVQDNADGVGGKLVKDRRDLALGLTLDPCVDRAEVSLEDLRIVICSHYFLVGVAYLAPRKDKRHSQ